MFLLARQTKDVASNSDMQLHIKLATAEVCAFVGLRQWRQILCTIIRIVFLHESGVSLSFSLMAACTPGGSSLYGMFMFAALFWSDNRGLGETCGAA